MTPISASNPWVKCARPRPAARLRLFCLPYAGGAASAFRTWWEHLPEHVEACAIQLPGREERFREPQVRRMPLLVETLAEVLEPCCELPFALLGHSLGALIAFELARRFRRTGAPQPVRLFLSGRRAPQLDDPQPPMYNLPEDEFVEQLCSRYEGLPDVIARDAELRALFLPIVRADVELVDTYTYTAEPPLECPISAYGGLDDSVSREELAAWQDQTTGSFQFHMLPGGHFFLNTETAALLRLVGQDL